MGWAARALPGLDPHRVAQLDALPRQTCAPDLRLFHAGDLAQGFAIVLDGRVEVHLSSASGREILLYAIEPGQSCIQTTLGLMGDAPYSGTATTVTHCTLVMIPAALFHDLINTSSTFRDFVFRAFAARMGEVTALLEQVAFIRIQARLARALLDMETGGAIHATHAELAARIGTAREVISRQLERWTAAGILHTGRGHIDIHDRAELRTLAK
ncbi:MAG: Crp/Fnr family transcriptional regulator [Rhodobacteraceae bacterium]|nr:Crp/Fnr family transcriptional regulator [Paracoccaceae bacterium]